MRTKAEIEFELNRHTEIMERDDIKWTDYDHQRLIVFWLTWVLDEPQQEAK